MFALIAVLIIPPDPAQVRTLRMVLEAMIALGLVGASLALCKRKYAEWEDEVTDFRRNFTELAPELRRVDPGWQMKARAAHWPIGVCFPYEEGKFQHWARDHGDALTEADVQVLRVACDFYALESVLHQPYHKEARQGMTSYATQWSKSLKRNPLFRLFFAKHIAKHHRDTLVMLAYLEAALSEKLAGRDGGDYIPKVEEWASLGDYLRGPAHPTGQP
jgi:hypothetical protein